MLEAMARIAPARPATLPNGQFLNYLSTTSRIIDAVRGRTPPPSHDHHHHADHRICYL